MPYKSSEKRKEKSRDAARCRRSKETEVFNEMAAELPLPPSVIAQLDKASVMRLTISNLRVQGIMEKRNHKGDAEEQEKEVTAEEQKIDGLYSKALEGFVFILSKEGDIVYVSEDVIKYLGIQQVDLMGQSVYEFAHPCDHSEVRDVLAAQSHGAKERRAFFLRLKCTLTNKGRSVNLKSATYKVIMCTGYLYLGGEEQENTAPGVCPYLLALAEPIPDPAYIEVPLDSRTFVSRHNLDMRFIECDDRIKKLIGYSSEELVGKSLFDFHHAEDSELIRRAYKTLFEKGQTMTEEYRFLAKRGGMVRIITQATVIRNNRTQKQQWVVCVHYVLSEVEERKAIMAVEQQAAAAVEAEEEEAAAAAEAVVLPEEMLAPYIGFHTDKIFAPRTKDMDEGLLPDSIKALYEDDDLTCLAPWAGEPNKELGCPDLPPSFCFDGEMEGSPVKQEFSPVKREAASAGLKEEPGLNLRTLCRLREECASNSVSPVSIPSRRSTPDEYLTAANPKDLESMDRFFSTMSTNHSNNKEEKEMDTRAPYVPMDMSQDFHLVAPSSDCLLAFPSDFNPGLFGKTETVFMNKSDFMSSGPSHRQKSVSMRDMVEGSTAVASIQQPPNTMPMQVKRPLDMNSLEKGPPPSKSVKMESGLSTGLGQSDSVLLNLLLTGEDKNHGYKVQVPLSQHIPQLAPSNRPVPRKSLCHLLLPRLTQRDCEVNAPTPNHSLLMGPEILQALEASGQETNGV